MSWRSFLTGGRVLVNTNISYTRGPAEADSCRRLVFDAFSGVRHDLNFEGTFSGGTFNVTSGGGRLQVLADTAIAQRKKIVLLVAYGPPNNAAWQALAGVPAILNADGSAIPSDLRSYRPMAQVITPMASLIVQTIEYLVGRFRAAGLSPSEFLAVQLGNEPYAMISPSADAGRLNVFLNALIPSIRAACTAAGIMLVSPSLDGYVGAGRVAASLAALRGARWWGSETEGALRRNYGLGDSRNPDWMSQVDAVAVHTYIDVRTLPLSSPRALAAAYREMAVVQREIVAAQTWAGWQDKPVVCTECIGASDALGAFAWGRGSSPAIRSDEFLGELWRDLLDELLGVFSMVVAYRAINDDVSHDTSASLNSGLILSTGQWKRSAVMVARALGGQTYTVPPTTLWNGGTAGWPSGFASDGVSTSVAVTS